MATDSFLMRLDTLAQAKGRALALRIAPRIEGLPLPIQAYDDPFLPFSKAIINATRDLVSVYIFDLAAYLALGAAGAIALERAIRYAKGDALTILHGPFADTRYDLLLDERAFAADAITVTDEVGRQYNEHSFFVCRAGEAQLTNESTYWIDQSLITMASSHITVAGEQVLYTDLGEHFAMRVREALEQFHG